MLPEEPTKEERLEEVDNDDHTTPFQAPDDIIDTSDNTHPSTDSGVQPEEAYDSGTAEAAGIQTTNNDTVKGYDPKADQRN